MPTSGARPARASLLTLLALAALTTRLPAQGLEYVKANYTKYEHRIAMRDGTRLFTAVYVPKDTSKRYPILLNRTPYSVRPYGVDQSKSDLGPSPLFGTSKYIFAYQDVRGRWMSEGEHVNMRPYIPDKSGPKDVDETSDTFDTIEWLVANVPNNTGKVGMWGISYPGFYTSCGMIDAHPALVAASPQAPISDWFIGDDFHHNGTLFLPHAFNFMANFGKPRPGPVAKLPHPPFEHGTPDGYAFFLRMGPLARADSEYFKGEVGFWNEMMAHGTYDEFWRSRNLRPHLKNIKPAVMTVGGWFDAENLFGALETYRSVESQGAKSQNILVMGPWFHGGWSRGDGSSLGHVKFDAKTSEFYRESIEFPFFEHHLKGQGELKHPEAWVFETGTNQWRQYDAWPPATAAPKSFHFGPEGALTFDPPSESGPDAFDEYVSDPARPVPSLDQTVIGMTIEYMVADQRHASRRPDVLVYQTDPLEEDLTLAGPLKARLQVSTTGTDSDWVVKLIDVYPDDYPDPDPNPTGVRMGGFQQLIRGEPMRGKFRNSFEKPEPFEPGEPTAVAWSLPDVYHTFRRGHRVMIQVHSSWFPLVDRNPQVFTDIYKAGPSDFRKANQRVYRSTDRASRVEVLALP